jgi:hypothetical protein
MHAIAIHAPPEDAAAPGGTLGTVQCGQVVGVA